MKLVVTRSNIRINPDHKIVIPRFFNTGNERSQLIIANVLKLSSAEADDLMEHIINEFAERYRNIREVFLKHYNQVHHLILPEKEQYLSATQKLLVGAYFTMEYSIEAAALFNPSVVEDYDQSGTKPGEKKVIVSFRAIGESHISSLIFKRGVIDVNGMIHFGPQGKYFSEARITMASNDNKDDLEKLLAPLPLSKGIKEEITVGLPGTFSYTDMETVLKKVLQSIKPVTEEKKWRNEILKLVNTSHTLDFEPHSVISERVIFPVTTSEKNGIEDARFVRFVEDDGSFTFIATYTAYDGSTILPQLILTKDFLHFTISPLHGNAAVNKNLALFPRKLNGRYAMIARIDGMNNYLMFSDDIFTWENATLLQQPKYPWEFIQIGNAGSPIETEKGWLVITHGVGPMRKYCLGASLFHIDDPSIELGRLKEPMLVPNEEERYGYVPNVVYSCGSIIHGDQLFIPYAVSDLASSFATVPLKELLDQILKDSADR